MASTDLFELLDRNQAHVESLPPDYFAAVQDAQFPTVVSICCSDSRVSQEGMWSVDEPGWLFTPSNVGNQVWDEVDGERVINGNLLFPLTQTGTRTIAVVGHTGCGAVTTAYRVATSDASVASPGLRKWVEFLVPIVRDGLASDAVDESRDDRAVINQLVEYNVHRQVAHLRASDEVPVDAAVYGFVYDFQRVYGDDDGRTYLVNLRGETDPDAIRAALPDEYADSVGCLLEGDGDTSSEERRRVEDAP